MFKLTLIGLLIGALAGISTAAVAGASSTKRVTMKNIALSPKTVTIKRGDRVQWVWRDGSIRHDVSFTRGGFKKSPLKSRGTYTLTFRKKGTFNYVCTVHRGDMKGRVVVR